MRNSALRLDFSRPLAILFNASREGDLPRQPALTGNGGEDDVARTGQQ
jgi:hypothetical protein